MQPEEIEIGQVYKINIPTAIGRFIVRRVYENKKGNWEAECIPEADRNIRFPELRCFYVSDLQSAEKKKGKSVAKFVVADLLDEIEGPWPEGVRLYNTKVHYWPERKESSKE